MKPQAIHQFHSGIFYGDGVSNSVLYMQRLLRAAGYESEIYCTRSDDRSRDLVNDYTAFNPSANALLLVHYSLGTDHDDWIETLPAIKILLYHNITPSRFFPVGSDLWNLTTWGRQRLAQWAHKSVFAAAIGLSDYNSAELRKLGFADVTTHSLLVDLDRLRASCPPITVRSVHEPRTILFIGRICEHKGQFELIEAFAALVRRVTWPLRLQLIGGIASDAYYDRCRRLIDQYGLNDRVEWLGRLEEADLSARFSAADLYLSLSQHEGFGMPLIEAMIYDLPVMALKRGNSADTLGQGGWGLDSNEPQSVAAAIELVLSEPAIRRSMLEGQRRNLRRFERSNQLTQFEADLRRRGFEVALTDPLGNKSALRSPEPSLWRVEGPCDSSYSLAIVNQALACALSDLGESVGVLNRDNDAPRPVDPAFLANAPQIRDMLATAQSLPVDVCLRNQYPPYVADMRGRLRVLANFAWEESGFPPDWVGQFNRTLDLITVTSRFVAKCLRDNGVFTPIAIVGNGVDHLAAVATSNELVPPNRPGIIRFVHVSSAFPRKGIDALLQAWVAAFNSTDPVELVIKSFANPHNTVVADWEALALAHPDHAPVIIYLDDWPADAVASLYDSADCVVCPSRGEGFGLPLAEAGWRGKALITTAYGGQSDFCTNTTAWLCDYCFAAARSHLELDSSVWVEPDIASLTRVLKEVATSPEERSRRGMAAQELIDKTYRWREVGKRTQAAVASLNSTVEDAVQRPQIGWVTTWNSRCGIATYSAGLACAFPDDHLMIFADRGAIRLKPDEAHVRRVWTQGWDDSLDDLAQSIFDADLAVVVIQFNFGFFKITALMRLLHRLHDAGIRTYLTLHSSMDVVRPDIRVSLGDHVDILAKVDRLFVHAVEDLNRLKSFGLIDNVALFPHGLPEPPNLSAARHQDLRPSAGPVIATFGFMLPNKGFSVLIEAFSALRKRYPAAHLLMLTSLYPADVSQVESDICRLQIKDLQLDPYVTLITDFLEEREIVDRLGAADVVVYPYQSTQESASGAIKLGLASLTPVAHTPLSIFSDIADAAYALPGLSAKDIAEGLTALLSDARLQNRLRERQKALATQRGWRYLSQRLVNLIRADARPIIERDQ